MSISNSKKMHGAERATGIFETIDGIKCEVIKKHYPVNKPDGPWRWYNAYRFTAPGWEECTIVGRTAAKRVIGGRTDLAVLNTLGINPYKKRQIESDKPERTSVLSAIQEHRNTEDVPHTQIKREGKYRKSEPDL